jgi:hypothetical protein
MELTKPVIINRVGKVVPLTFAEHDTNFANLRNATITLKAGTGGTDVVSDLNGTITLLAGAGVQLLGDNSAKTVQISTTESQNIFQSIAVAGQSTIIADSTSDTLTLVAGTNVTITTNATTDTITINSLGSDLVNDLTPQLGGDLSVNGFKIVSEPASNGNIVLNPDGLGQIKLEAGTISLSSGSSGGLITTPGVGGITIRPNSNTGATLVVQGSSTAGNVSLTPSGTGSITLNGPVSISSTAGTPSTYENGYYEDMLVTPVTWLKITVGGVDYYLPLFQ